MEQWMANCKGCGRLIVWTKMKSGKKMPCDPEIIRFIPDEGKEVFITPEGETKHGRRVGVVESLMGYVPHWSTCEKMKQFKAKG